MHKRRQPVKLWYLSSFFRHERAQAGPLPPVLAGRRGGARLRGPGRRRRVDRAARDAAEELGVAGVRLRLSSLGSSGRASATASSLQAHLRAHADSALRGCARAHRAEPAAGVRLRSPRHARGDGRARRCLLESLDAATTPRTSPRSARLLDAAGVAYEIDPTLVRGLDYYTRTVFELTSDALGAQCGVGGGGRYDGLVESSAGADPGHRLGRRNRAHPARGRAPPAAPPPVDLFVAEPRRCSVSDGPRSERAARARYAPRRFALLSEARAAGLTAQMELAGRSLKGQLGHANRSAPATSRSSATAMSCAERHAGGRPADARRRARSCTRSCVACTRSEAHAELGYPVREVRRRGFSVQLSRLICRSRGR